jgi:hypothetical protein
MAAQPSSGPAEAATIGFVLEEAGLWTADGKPLHRYDELTPGSVVRLEASSAAAPARRQGIVILLNDGHTLACEGADACQAPIALPKSLEESPSFFQRISALFEAQRERFEATLTRGAGARADDAILPRSHGTIDVSALLAPLDRDASAYESETYTAVITSLDEGSTRELTLHRARSGSLPLPVEPGLYSLSLGAPYAAAPLLADVWVLAVEADRYADVTQQYAAARAVEATWPQAAGDDARRAFLRAALQALESPK